MRNLSVIVLIFTCPSFTQHQLKIITWGAPRIYRSMHLTEGFLLVWKRSLQPNFPFFLSPHSAARNRQEQNDRITIKCNRCILLLHQSYNLITLAQSITISDIEQRFITDTMASKKVIKSWRQELLYTPTAIGKPPRYNGLRS